MAGKGSEGAERLRRDDGPDDLEGAPRVFLVKGRDALRIVRFDEIEWVGAEGSYCSIHTADGTYLVRRGIGELEERLQGQPFLRVSRSAIVNLHSVERLVPWFHGGYQVRLVSGVKLKLTSRYAQRMFLRIGRPL